MKMKERAGCYRTNLSGDMAYKSFVPNKLPPNPQDMIQAMSDLEKYINTEDDMETDVSGGC